MALLLTTLLWKVTGAAAQVQGWLLPGCELVTHLQQHHVVAAA
jgi:hypothetical protein